MLDDDGDGNHGSIIDDGGCVTGCDDDDDENTDKFECHYYAGDAVSVNQCHHCTCTGRTQSSQQASRSIMKVEKRVMRMIAVIMMATRTAVMMVMVVTITETMMMMMVMTVITVKW